MRKREITNSNNLLNKNKIEGRKLQGENLKHVYKDKA